jgi:copper chaperone CopZ
MAKQLFRVLDMHCSNCVMTIEGLEDDLPGVKSVRASYHKGTVEVEYDEKRVTEAAIKDAITRLGYAVA